jgi:hypothetical protein
MKTRKLKLPALNKYANLRGDDRENVAKLLLGSPRGRYVMGQALAIGYETLKNTEPSNAEDIALIGDTFFKPFYQLKVSGVL